MEPHDGKTPGLTLLGASATPVPASPDEARLEAFENAHPDRDYWIEFDCPEFTALCPVTGQPDLGSLLVRYEGPRIDRAALLRYIVSYRCHQDFHENCIERMFVDILECCRPEALTVCGRYQRRGGIDINPFRSNFEEAGDNPRLWRQ